MRILAIDYGRKRIGIALSDPMQMIAQPHDYIDNDSQFLTKLKALLAEKEVGEIVVGLPHSMSGNPSEMTKEVEQFVKRWQRHVGVPIHFYDERLSTWEAENVLVESKVRRKDRKGLRDQVAAALILQGYLQSRKP